MEIKVPHILYDIISTITGDGYKIGGIVIKTDGPIEMKFDKSGIIFTKNPPTIRYQHKGWIFSPIIDLSVLGIKFHDTGGTIIIENFPDINFRWSDD